MTRRALMLAAALTCIPWRAPLALDVGDMDFGKVVSGGTKLVKAAGGLSDAEEIQLGRDIAANLAARYGLVESASEVRYVNFVGQALVSHSERKKIPYHFGILHTSEVNALAAPGGYVFITQGLLDTLKDESELAGVLAHEISHITHMHIVKAIRQANLLDGSKDLAAASGQNVDQFAPLSDFSINLLSKGLSRGDELEADKYGTLLAARTGYDAYGLRRSIEGLALKQKTVLMMDRFNKTHPPAKDRLKVIDHTIKSSHLTPTGQRLGDRFLKRLAASTR